MLIGMHAAFISAAETALGLIGKTHTDELFDTFDRRTVYVKGRNAGRPVNTLTLVVPVDGKEKEVGIRGPYDAFSRVVRGKLRRFDYPSSGPHSTQAWSGNQDTLKTIFAMTPGERRATAEGLWSLAMELEEQRRREAPRSGVAPFVTVLEGFHPESGRGEATGAVLQGLAYGYVRADAPTLNVATAKVRASSKREGRVGDVDGREGPTVALAVEVKDYRLDDAGELTDFIANLGEWPDAIAFCVCRDASDDFVEAAAEHNITVVTRAQMIQAARLWPLTKQATAVAETLGYFVHYEQSSSLIHRYVSFLEDHDLRDLLPPATTVAGDEPLAAAEDGDAQDSGLDDA